MNRSLKKCTRDKQELTRVSSRLTRTQIVLQAPTSRTGKDLLIKMKNYFILVSKDEKHAKEMAWGL